MKDKPNLFILGPPRTGSTSLHAYLSSHPLIDGGAEKEPKFFLKEQLENQGGSILRLSFRDSFKGFYSRKVAKYRLDATPGYLMYFRDGVLSEIMNKCESPKFIILLRNPLERSVSLYNYLNGRGLEKKSFNDALQSEENRLDNYWNYMYAYRKGNLNLDVLNYLVERVPKDDLFFLYSEALRKDYKESLRSIYEWLGLPPVDQVVVEYNQSRAVKNRLVSWLFKRESRVARFVYRFLIERVPRNWLEKSFRLVSNRGTTKKASGIKEDQDFMHIINWLSEKGYEIN